MHLPREPGEPARLQAPDSGRPAPPRDVPPDSAPSSSSSGGVAWAGNCPAGALASETSAVEHAPAGLARRVRERLLAGDLAGAKELLAGLPVSDARELIADLERLIRGSPGEDAQFKALHALASIDGDLARAAVVRIAREASLPARLRREAVLLLGNRPADAAGERDLATFCQDGEAGVRLAAVQALGRPGRAGALGLLAEAATGDPSPGVRGAALQSIGRIGTPEATLVLLARLGDDSLPAEERERARRALPGIADRASGPALRDALIQADDADLRRTILSTLAKMADPALFDLLAETMEHDPDLESRCEAMQGLGLLGASADRALPTLRARAATGAERERSYATTAIRRIEAAGR